MAGIVKKAYEDMYPDRVFNHDATLKYSRAFKGYNANVKFTNTHMHFRLSYSWKEVSEDIKTGLIQSLLNKIFKTNIRTLNIELYEIFLKKIPVVSKKTESEPLLEDSFNRMNEQYFYGMMLTPNLVFGGKNVRTLGTYSYNDDTIMISSILKKDLRLLDYVMFHEMLNKKLGGKKAAKRTVHHSKEFRKLEKMFQDKDAERKLQNFVRKERFFGGLF